jgi:hypothetical protein
MICLGLAAHLPLALVAATSPPGADEKKCGPPSYCARTDRRIVPYPATPPTLGPAGSIIEDPSFGSRILRVTDAKSDPLGMGRSMMTPSASEQNPWNTDGSKFYVMTPGGQFVLYDFDPGNLKTRKDRVLPVPWSGEPEFSYTQPNILYGMRIDKPVFQQYDVSSDKVSRVHLISDCLQVNSADHAGGAMVSADDQRLATAIGPVQDKLFVIYVYDRKLGCRWYNTQTGEIGGKWGPMGTIAIPDRYRVHNARMSKSGDFIWIQRGASSVGQHWLVWDLATMKVTACPSQCSGHHAMGYSHLVGPSGEGHPLDLLLRPLASLTTMTPLVPDLQPTSSARYWYDQHFSWNYINSQDTTPVCLSTYSDSNPDTPGAPLDTIAPWENEVLCVETDGKAANVWRFAHTYSTAKNGFWSTPRGNVSRDGRFFLFTSDWQDQLGEGVHKKHHRSDVFIVELR